MDLMMLNLGALDLGVLAKPDSILEFDYDRGVSEIMHMDGLPYYSII